MPKTLRTVLLSPGEAPLVMYLTDDLRNFQEAVGGYIEHIVVRIPDVGAVDAYINEEGRLMDLPPNRSFVMGAGYRETVVGPVLFIGPADANGNTLNLPEDTARKLVEYLSSEK